MVKDCCFFSCSLVGDCRFYVHFSQLFLRSWIKHKWGFLSFCHFCWEHLWSSRTEKLHHLFHEYFPWYLLQQLKFSQICSNAPDQEQCKSLAFGAFLSSSWPWKIKKMLIAKFCAHFFFFVNVIHDPKNDFEWRWRWRYSPFDWGFVFSGWDCDLATMCWFLSMVTCKSLETRMAFFTLPSCHLSWHKMNCGTQHNS